VIIPYELISWVDQWSKVQINSDYLTLRKFADFSIKPGLLTMVDGKVRGIAAGLRWTALLTDEQVIEIKMFLC
jgi:hypothetical protein